MSAATSTTQETTRYSRADCRPLALSPHSPSTFPSPSSLTRRPSPHSTTPDLRVQEPHRATVGISTAECSNSSSAIDARIANSPGMSTESPIQISYPFKSPSTSPDRRAPQSRSSSTTSSSVRAHQLRTTRLNACVTEDNQGMSALSLLVPIAHVPKI